MSICPNQAVSYCSGADLGEKVVGKAWVGSERSSGQALPVSSQPLLSAGSFTLSKVLQKCVFIILFQFGKELAYFFINNIVKNCIYFRLKSPCARLQLKENFFPE